MSHLNKFKKFLEMYNPAIIIKEEWVEEKPEVEYCNAVGIDTRVNAKNFYFKVEATETFQDWCVGSRILEGSHEVGDDLKEINFQKCSLCDSFFINRYVLYEHNLTHLRVLLTEPNLYQCDNCYVYFTNEAKLLEHAKTKHITKNIIKKNNSSELFTCHICHKVYKYKQWHGHMANVHGTGTHKCLTCNQTFKCLSYLKRHQKHKHEGIKPSKIEGNFRCEHCPKNFIIKNLLKHHIENCHGNTVVCTICNSKLRSEKYLQSHMRRVHYDDGKIHRCPFCDTQFKSPRYVRIHMRNFHKKNPQKCKCCNKIYLRKSNFKKHLDECYLLDVKEEIKVD